MEYRVSIVIEKDHHGYYAFSPEIEGCHTQGASLQDVIEQVRKTIAQYLEQDAHEPVEGACVARISGILSKSGPLWKTPYNKRLKNQRIKGAVRAVNYENVMMEIEYDSWSHFNAVECGG